MFDQRTIVVRFNRPTHSTSVTIVRLLLLVVVGLTNAHALGQEVPEKQNDGIAEQVAPKPTSRLSQDEKQIDDREFLLYRSSLAAAEKALRLNETRDARYWLDQAPPKLQGWEWQYLNGQCDESLASLDFGNDVTSVAISPDGSVAAAADVDGGVTLIRMSDISVVRKIGDHEQAVYSVAFSPDSKRLVTVSRDVTSRVWDVETGKEISRLQLDNPGVAAATFSPDGQSVATCTWYMTGEGDDRQVHGVVWIWDAATGKVKTRKDVGIKPLDSIAWSTDGKTLAVGSWDGLVHVLDENVNEIKTLTVPDEGIYTAVIAVAISPDGRRIVAGSKDRTTRVWDVADGELIATATGHEGFVNEVQFVGDANHLLTASVDGTIRSWLIEESVEESGSTIHSAKPLQIMRGHLGSVSALAIAPDNETVVSGGRDHTIRFWNGSATYGGRVTMHPDIEGTYATVFSPDGDWLYVACHDGQVRVFDTRSGDVVDQWEAHPESPCNTLDLSGDGTRLVTCSWDKTARIWNPVDHALIHTLEAGAGVLDCAISRDGTIVALAVGSEAQVWDAASGQRIGTCAGDGGTVSEVTCSPDGKTVASAGVDGTRVYDTSTRKLLASLVDGDGPTSAVAFSRDGSLIASASTGKVDVWKADNYTIVQTTSIGDSPVSRLAFSPDGRRLAAGSDAVSMIDPLREGVLLRFQPNDDTLYYLAFSPDGQRLSTCTTGGSIVISETEPLRERLNEDGSQSSMNTRTNDER